MKKLLFFVSLCLVLASCSSDNNQNQENTDIALSKKDRYKLYQTENVFTLLQLDTETGKIEQVQWAFESEDEGSISINSENLSYGNENDSGIFELYPTKNMYQFILINKSNGRKWHVQWGLEDDKRWIRPIK